MQEYLHKFCKQKNLLLGDQNTIIPQVITICTHKFNIIMDHGQSPCKGNLEVKLFAEIKYLSNVKNIKLKTVNKQVHYQG